MGIDGLADPGATITLYRVLEDGQKHGPLSEVLSEITADESGRFGVELSDLNPGDRISAIATHPDYGTSEPALNAAIRTANPTTFNPSISKRTRPVCESSPLAVAVQPPQVEPALIKVKVPHLVYFDSNQADLDVVNRETLNQIVDLLQAYPQIVVDLHGHTDTRASAAYNHGLAQQRALSVRRYLLQQGIDSARITVRAWGETQLRTPEQTQSDMAQNRRVEIVYRQAEDIPLVLIDPGQTLQVD
ncbi:MAG: OmpA family protein [Cyanobacteria bacterium P01_F01_bin.42]